MKAILTNNTIELIFSYDPAIINQVKQIPGRIWNPFPINRWTVPYNKSSVNSLIDIGFNMKEIVKDIAKIEEQQQETFKKSLIKIKKEFPFLYNYQVEAVAKGIINKKLYLADTMGLGKSVTSSSITEHFMNNNEIQKTFILCPSSIINQWRETLEEFHQKSYKVVSSKYKKNVRAHIYRNYDRIITTYDLIANDFITVQPLIENQGLILDEATRIKNPTTRRYKALCQLKPKISVFNSGTPFETKLTDVYNVCNVLHPKWMTKREYYSYCDYDQSSKYPLLLGYKNLDKFADRFNEIGIKREFKDVCSEAPEVSTYNHVIPQDKEQLRIQDIIKQRTQDDFIASATLLQMLGSHSQLLLGSLSLIVKDIYPKRASPKLDYLNKLLEEHNDMKIVIFSRFINMRKLLEKALPKDYNTYTIETIQNFKKVSSNNKSILILGDSSIYGVDIPEASMLINFDILWNPAKMLQRNARIHRISSTHNIKIINLISEGIEQYMFDYNQQCIKDSKEATSINGKLREFIRNF